MRREDVTETNAAIVRLERIEIALGGVRRQQLALQEHGALSRRLIPRSAGRPFVREKPASVSGETRAQKSEIKETASCFAT